MENKGKKINVKIINNTKDYIRCVSKRNFISQKTFDKNFVAVHQIKPILTLNKPIYVGVSTLELSKLLMYKFHYEYVKNKFDAKLLFTDADSLVYETKTEDVYEECFKDRELFDFSKYPVDSNYHGITNKKVFDKMKNEFKGQIISEFIGLKNKMYSLISVDDEEVNKAKVVNKKIKHKEFADVLFKKEVVRYNMKRIQNKFMSLELMMFTKFYCLVLMIKDTN